MSTTIEHDTQQPVESQTTTALAVVTRSIAEINAVEATVVALEEKYRGVVFQVDTTDGMKDACKARAEIREPRYTLQNMQKAAKAPLNELKKSIDEQTEGFIARIAAVEEPIHSQIKAEEDKKAAEKKAKAEAEAKRIAAIEERISDIREAVTLAAGKSSVEIAAFIAKLEAVAIDATFAEFQQRAETAKAATLVRLKAAFEAAEKLEAEQKRLADERAELERQRVAQDAAQAAERIRQCRLSEISNIRGQVTVASLGRTGNGLTDRPGGTIDCIRETLDETRRWPITDERFGPEWEAARDAKADAVGQIERLLQQAEAQEAEAKRLADEKAEQDAENARIKAAQDARDAEAAEQRRLQDEENERVRRHNEAALKKVTALHEQLSVAIRGREPDIKGGDVESFDQVIAETEALPITLEEFGLLIESARQTKAHTVNILKMRRVELIQQIADEAAAQAERHRLATERAESDQKEAERVAAAQAEERRIADERAELERQQSALKLSQETVAAPSDPVEATKADAVQAIVDELNAPADGFPSNDEIIHAVAQAFFVPESTAVEYILRVADECRQMEAA